MTEKTPLSAFRILHSALCISFCILFSAFCIASPSDHGDHFSDEEHIALDLGGKSREVEKWHQGKWSAQDFAVSNGVLTFTKAISVRGGRLAGTPFGQVDVMQVDDESTIADLRRYDLLVFGGWNTMYAPIHDLLERYVKEGGTLVMSRPELTTRLDRDFINYTDADLMPPFGFLPPEGKPGEYVEKRFGKGRLFLFTARTFPDATKEGCEAYKALVEKLASEVKQSATISSETPGETDAICFAVYPNKAYFLNMDTRRARTFDYVLDGKRGAMTLKPCEIRILNR